MRPKGSRLIVAVGQHERIPLPPKVDESLVALFSSLGLTSAKSAELARSPKQAAALKDLITAQGLEGAKLDERTANLLAAAAVDKAWPALGVDEKAYLVGRVKEGDLKEGAQVAAGIKYLATHPAPVDKGEFDHETGVGIVVPITLIVSHIESSLPPTLSSLPNPWSGAGPLLKTLKDIPELRWANPADVKNEVERIFGERFGSREECLKRAKEAAKSAPKEPKKTVAVKEDKKPAVVEAPAENMFEVGFLGQLHKPGGNPQIKLELRDAHLKATGGKVITRFPPEPNGFLHIGHSKAIAVNFGYAAHHNGHTYLRYDDTNPEAEEQVYFESILEMVRWLGFEPWKITYSSDYFRKLYELAVELIKRGKAYVDHSTAEEMKIQRGGEERGPRTASRWRDRPVEESLALFEDMREGKFQPGEATLRMKQDLEDGNPQMWDLVAYRVLNAPHHRTGADWKIYPTYDFTHCLVDSFENISHSLCTTEFILSRVSYDWLCDALEVYKPRQSEYGRLNLQGTVMSKRKILKLVKEGHVRGWDDPRLYTLIALRRRGVPPSAILSFVNALGVSTALSNIPVARFEQSVRADLESSVPRLAFILRPLKLTLENVDDDYFVEVEKPLHPKVPSMGTAKVPFTKTVYIDRSDFRTEDSKDYFRLAPGKTVGLLSAPYPVTCTSFKTDPATGEVTELFARLEIPPTPETPIKKPKAFIQWVAEHKPSRSPVVVDETRIFHQLFKSDNPAAADDFIADIDPNSEEIVRGALVEVSFWALARKLLDAARVNARERTKSAIEGGVALDDAPVSAEERRAPTPKLTAEQLVGPECIRFQGLRVAYFAVDKDSRLASTDEGDAGEPGWREGDRLVLNRIVSLKEDSAKNA